MKNKNRIYLVLGLLALCQSPLHANATTEDISKLNKFLGTIDTAVSKQLPNKGTIIPSNLLSAITTINSEDSKEALEALKRVLPPALNSLDKSSKNLGGLLKWLLSATVDGAQALKKVNEELETKLSAEKVQELKEELESKFEEKSTFEEKVKTEVEKQIKALQSERASDAESEKKNSASSELIASNVDVGGDGGESSKIGGGDGGERSKIGGGEEAEAANSLISSNVDGGGDEKSSKVDGGGGREIIDLTDSKIGGGGEEKSVVLEGNDKAVQEKITAIESFGSELAADLLTKYLEYKKSGDLSYLDWLNSHQADETVVPKERQDALAIVLESFEDSGSDSESDSDEEESKKPVVSEAIEDPLTKFKNDFNTVKDIDKIINDNAIKSYKTYTGKNSYTEWLKSTKGRDSTERIERRNAYNALTEKPKNFDEELNELASKLKDQVPSSKKK
jgi:RNA binding exosome subunit